MFSNLRAGNQVYVLHKDATPYLDIAQVVSVTAPMPNFAMNTATYVVDIVVSINGQQHTFQRLNANADISTSMGNGNVIVATSREAMNAELQSMRQKSIEAINSVDYHRGVVGACDEMYHTLNPEIAEKEAQQEEINTLKAQLSQLTSTMNDLVAQLKGGKAKQKEI